MICATVFDENEGVHLCVCRQGKGGGGGAQPKIKKILRPIKNSF